ncbi:hypothetical protein FQN49_008342, partial [Arthroderma sp. PD_2]
MAPRRPEKEVPRVFGSGSLFQTPFYGARTVATSNLSAFRDTGNEPSSPSITSTSTPSILFSSTVPQGLSSNTSLNHGIGRLNICSKTSPARSIRSVSTPTVHSTPISNSNLPPENIPLPPSASSEATSRATTPRHQAVPQFCGRQRKSSDASGSTSSTPLGVVDNRNWTPFSTPTPAASTISSTSSNRTFRGNLQPVAGGLFSRSSQSQTSIANGVEGLNLVNAPNSAANGSLASEVTNSIPFQRPAEGYRYSAANNERVPVDLQYYSPGFQERLREGAQVATNIARVIRRSEVARYADQRLQDILETACDLSSFRPQTERKVAVVGNTGTGKSSLINALLDRENLSDTSGLGTAVTSFVTEYRYLSDNEDFDYRVEIEYLHDADLDNEIVHLLADLRKFHQPGLDVSAQDHEELELKSESAGKALSLAFGRHRDWDLQGLSEFGPGAYEHALLCLRNWAQQIQWPNGIQNGCLSTRSRDVNGIKNVISRRESEPAWSFVKIVR